MAGFERRLTTTSAKAEPAVGPTRERLTFDRLKVDMLSGGSLALRRYEERHTIFISVVVFRVFSIEAEWVIFSIG